MVTFGFSAFLKLLSLNEKPQKTELKRRLGPPSSGYDYHRSFRLHARRYLVDGQEISDVIASASKITQETERLSAVAALRRLEIWRESNPGRILTLPSIIIESPGRLFKVKFEPDFGIQIGKKTTAVHIWNTMNPKLSRGPTYAAMTLVAQAFESEPDAPEDVAVLSAREPPALYRLSDVPDQTALAEAIVARLEDTIRGTSPSSPPPEHRAPPP